MILRKIESESDVGERGVQPGQVDPTEIDAYLRRMQLECIFLPLRLYSGRVEDCQFFC